MNIIKNESLEAIKARIRQQTEKTVDPQVEARVTDIIKNVRANGDEALKEYGEKFDGVTLDNLKVTDSQIEEAFNQVNPAVIKALEKAADNIRSFHKLEIGESFEDNPSNGVIRGTKVTPLSAVGIYVPGGTAAYPSSVLMNAIPAKIAGVENIIMVTPPQKNGLNQAVLAAAKIAGVDRIYQVGGAQAIAALAYGTESIPQVDKITGPGNAYVATAKRDVYGQVDIDMIAGPSEIGILADDSASAKDVAADLLSQAEHDVNARAILITNSEKLATAVSKEVEDQLKVLPREAIARQAIENNGFIYLVDTIDLMIDLMNAVAPEHLEIQLENAYDYISKIKNAGSVFLGKYASEPLGDYLAGPNHILPTGGTARFSSPLGVWDFQKRIQYLQYSAEALLADSADVTVLAREEGLEAHARAIESREK
ncbi:histidinol dehydrogenase [Leuconostoc mesenteroides]|uniref:Histidinol dehydrogenase n=1 Tax=Leuconostoc mesenteroides subsp. mesenteroides (strain ATCC 8293 / DSM 20343 / BCRC 11652 / CCM 1803 / JCM 6124 / NCDO 523 / NBRC 100496 / NCIMB 8023 / NCTC 12954 / NRRL B-1118 / 37Y) TaxID=203120 RepID=Q03VX6_LEUMM|nr:MULTISPECIES: histidinol dehydrogenase [Leuconostoc]ABJ62646.1 histidinol dehydrogenase [Leuconostoc mesenteroides subsp. mesenteroides ATCC 8293]MBD9366803.1 histidinol dehydrogenase [Leuconostoc mesenteroides]MCT3042121.1 histidinol dehydrogenase [Leuconostoc mesenteroides]MCU4664373.1 histidinol dehydrogenase [Leuconostoc mesenteroides]MDG9747465.1 histidinol dehydrogenase [Leuconostoc mesenteroides]